MPVTKADQSYVTVTAKGSISGYIGPDATALMRARLLRTAIEMWRKHRILTTRHMSISRLLEQTSMITGKTYTPKVAERAEADLTIWIDNMASALPVVTGL